MPPPAQLKSLIQEAGKAGAAAPGATGTAGAEGGVGGAVSSLVSEREAVGVNLGREEGLGGFSAVAHVCP